MASSGPAPKKLRVTEERRRFLPAWKSEYPWVFVNDGAMYCACEYCKDAGKNNAFTNGCLKFKKGALKKHVATVDHHVALAAKSGRLHWLACEQIC